MAEKDGALDKMKKNKILWSEYKENDEDKEIYKKSEFSRLRFMRTKTQKMRLSTIKKYEIRSSDLLQDKVANQ